MTDRPSREVREAVAQRANFRCEYCGTPGDYCPDPLSVEHVEPRSSGGSDDPSNLALSCQGCNNHKYVRTSATDPVTGETVALFHPRRHVWSDHFCWCDDFTELIGRTPTGRATILALRLNRPGVLNLRRVLHATAVLRHAEVPGGLGMDEPVD